MSLKKSILSVVSLAMIFCFLISASARLSAAGPEGTPSVFMRVPWLKQSSPFVQDVDSSKSAPSITSLGAFGVGNGNVFALIGLGDPQNTLSNIVGPNYEKSEGENFFPVWHWLGRAAGKGGKAEKMQFTRSRLRRVPKTGIVVNEETGDSVSVTTITYAPWGTTSIIRIITIKNLSASALENASLAVESSFSGIKTPVYEKDKLSRLLNGRRMAVGFVGGGAVANTGQLVMPVPALQPGDEAEFVLHITFQPENARLDISAIEKAGQYPLLEETRQGWLKWFDGALEVESSDPKLAGLFESVLALMKTEQTSGGVISPMGKYSGLWCRDNFGPVRFLLPAGKTGDVRKSLEYFDLATRINGFGNRYQLDVDISQAPAKPDWEKFAPQQGDDPLLLILEFYHYYLATGDVNFVREHYGFLRRNLTAQKHTDFRLPFNGDETYQVYVMMTEHLPLRDFFTPASGFMFSSAALALSEMADAIGERSDAETFAALSIECRKKTEEFYWNDSAGFYIPYARKDNLKPADGPFADVNLTPLWIDYAPASDVRQRRNVVTSADKLMSKRGVMKSSAKCALYTGMVPGMLVYNLKALGINGRADLAYTAMMQRVLSSAGEFAEGYDSRDSWINYGSAPTVYRPWESGINAEAVLFYITGMKFDPRTNTATFQPHLPPGVDWVRFSNLHAGRGVFAVEIKRSMDNSVRIEVKNTGGGEIETELLVELPAQASSGDFDTKIDFPDYLRQMGRRVANLAPGDMLSAVGGN